MKRVLLVCTGNTCRSPMAAALLRQLANEEGLAWEVESAGICCPRGREGKGQGRQGYG
ncbi:MAG TPA: hypothetical protein VNL15_02410 [Dehalococcoidia bacterium]|nr:hypothetical protein [Dehalococcoidia bacterium]